MFLDRGKEDVETRKAKVGDGGSQGVWQSSVLRTEMLALPVTDQDAANLAFPADECKNRAGGPSLPNHSAMPIMSDAVSYTHLDVYKRQVKCCERSDEPSK